MNGYSLSLHESQIGHRDHGVAVPQCVASGPSPQDISPLCFPFILEYSSSCHLTPAQFSLLIAALLLLLLLLLSFGCQCEQHHSADSDSDDKLILRRAVSYQIVFSENRGYSFVNKRSFTYPGHPALGYEKTTHCLPRDYDILRSVRPRFHSV